jgi:ACS family glucarate transporter-like MFS transporter
MPSARPLQIRALLVFLLFLLSAVAFLDRTNISIAGPAIQHELGIGNQQLGGIFSAFLIGYAAFQVVGGWLAFRFGPRRTLATGVLWWGLFTALTAIASPRLAHPLLVLILIRFGLGAGEAVIYPASNQFVAQWIPVSERGNANGWIFAGVGAGAGLSIPVLTWIIAHLGWRASFWFCALLGILVGLAWYTLARDTPEQHPHVSPEELRLIQTLRTISAPSPAATKISKSSSTWTAALLNRNVLALTLSYFAFGYVAWIFFSWFFIYMAQAHAVDLKSNAFLSMIPFLAMTVCCLAGGLVNDSISRRFGLRRGRCGVVVFSLALTAILLVIGSQIRNPLPATLVLAAGAGSLYLSQSSFWSVSADIAGLRSGVVSGVMNMGCQIGGAVTASLTPFLAARFGWSAAFLTAAVLVAAGGALWLFVDPAR